MFEARSEIVRWRGVPLPYTLSLQLCADTGTNISWNIITLYLRTAEKEVNKLFLELRYLDYVALNFILPVHYLLESFKRYYKDVKGGLFFLRKESTRDWRKAEML